MYRNVRAYQKKDTVLTYTGDLFMKAKKVTDESLHRNNLSRQMPGALKPKWLFLKPATRTMVRK